MPDPTIDTILENFERMKSRRSTWEQHWQDLSEVMLPRRATFTAALTPGSKRTAKIFDGTAMIAARQLASAIDGLIKPKTTKWFSIRATDHELNEVDAVKEWLEDTQNRMYAEIYNPKAHFLQATGEVDQDLVVLGTGCLFTGLATDRSHLSFRSYHLRDTYIDLNADTSIDTLYLRRVLTVRQAVALFGEDNLGKIAKEFIRDGKFHEEIEYLQAIMPRTDRNPRLMLATHMPFASIWIEVASQHKVIESGFPEFPFQIPRWDTASEEIYGRSPGMLALPDTRTLQAQGKTLLKAGQRAADPPLLAMDDSIVGAPKLHPDGITYFNAASAAKMRGAPIFPLQGGTNMAIGREMQMDTRELIMQAFFRNVLQLPTAGPQMTATEIIERKEEFMRILGPVFGRLEADYPAPTVERVFNLMTEARAFKEPPEELIGRDIKFEFVSPVERARKQVEAAGAVRSSELLQPYIEAQPEIMDNFDGDRIARDISEAHGMPQAWLRSPDTVRQIRDRRAQAQQAQQQLEMAERGAAALGQMPDDMRQQITGGQGGPPLALPAPGPENRPTA